MAQSIPISKGYVTVVDDDVYQWASLYRWYAQPGRNTAYAVRCGPRDQEGRRLRHYLHREILGLPPWTRGAAEVDHIDRNGLNNLRANLRVVSHQGNATNRANGKLPDKACPVCGTLFSPGRRSAVFCSSRCFGLRPDNPRTQRILADRTCPTCGGSFRPANHRSKYCSLSCRSKGRWAIP